MSIEIGSSIGIPMGSYTPGSGGGAAGLEVEVVSTLPAQGESGILYLVPIAGATGNDTFEEYVWLEDEAKYERLGTTDIDLSNYYTTDEVDSKLVNKQDKMNTKNPLSILTLITPGSYKCAYTSGQLQLLEAPYYYIDFQSSKNRNVSASPGSTASLVVGTSLLRQTYNASSAYVVNTSINSKTGLVPYTSFNSPDLSKLYTLSNQWMYGYFDDTGVFHPIIQVTSADSANYDAYVVMRTDDSITDFPSTTIPVRVLQRKSGATSGMQWAIQYKAETNQLITYIKTTTSKSWNSFSYSPTLAEQTLLSRITCVVGIVSNYKMPSSTGLYSLSAITDYVTGEVVFDSDPGTEVSTNTLQLNLSATTGNALEIKDDGLFAAAGSSSSVNDKYGIKADYATHYGILDCPNGLIDYNATGYAIKVNPGVVLVAAGNGGTKTTIASAINYTLTVEEDNIVLFYAAGELIEAVDVFYQVDEPEDGATGYAAWYNPEVGSWKFKSNNTGNVWRTAVATPIANIKRGASGILRLDYIGYRILDDAIIAQLSDIENLQDQIDTISTGGGYTLPAATTTTLGGVKPDGSTITVTADGTISSVSDPGGTLQTQINGIQTQVTTLDTEMAAVQADALANTNALGGHKIVDITQDAYDALVTKDEDTLYIITDATAVENAKTDLSNLSDAGKKVIDGQWTVTPEAVNIVANQAEGIVTVDISEYLPNDSANYEILVWYYTVSNMFMNIKSLTNVAGWLSPAGGSDMRSMGVLPIDSSRQIICEINGSGDNRIQMVAYRRLGTNA